MSFRFDILLNAPPPQVRRTGKNSQSTTSAGFTLVELLISVSIFAVVVVIVSSLYVDMIRLNVKANLQKQIYSEARFLMKRLEKEIHNSMIDYDEYYAQNVVIPSNKGIDNFGQNYGRYYSSFYNPGADNLLGFDCNEADANSPTGFLRNKTNCVMKTNTKDKNTGQNPFEGKQGGSDDVTKESAFCGAINYKTISDANSAPTPKGNLPWDDNADLCDLSKPHPQHELYLISKDATQKIIISRERIGTDSNGKPMYTLSWLKMKGEDSDGDKVIDKFKCADGFECTKDSQDCSTTELPASREDELNPEDSKFNAEPCETKETIFGKDFVPILPVNINVTRFDVYIFPAENPHYAFAEDSENSQPYVSIVLTVELNQQKTALSKEMFSPITLVETVYSNVSASIPAPLLVQ